MAERKRATQTPSAALELYLTLIYSGEHKKLRGSLFKIQNTLKAIEMLKRVPQLWVKTTNVMLREGASRIKKNSGLLCGARMVDQVITSAYHDCSVSFQVG